MPVGQFSTYDIITDVVPGSVFLLLIYLSIPTNWIPDYSGSILTTGVILLLGGFLAGRIIHGLSSYSISRLPKETMTDTKYLSVVTFWFIFSPGLVTSTSFLTLMGLIYHRLFNDDNVASDANLVMGGMIEVLNDTFGFPPSDEEDGASTNSEETYMNQIDEWFSESSPSTPEGIDSKIVGSVSEKLSESMSDGGLDSDREISPKSKRQYGETLLYGDATLYSKYEMIRTFFRSVMFLSISVGLVYLFVGLLYIFTDNLDGKLLGYNLTMPMPGIAYLLASILFLVIFATATLRRREFIERSQRAYIYDLYQKLDFS